MRRLFIWPALLFALAGQSQNELPERSGFTLNVKRNATQTFVQQINPGPYFPQTGALQLYPNERVFVEVEIKADTIFSMKTVRENLHPQRTLEIEFCQSESKTGARPSELWVKNPLATRVSFNVLAHSVTESAWQSRAEHVLPVRTGHALWKKEIVSSLVLKDWKLP